MIGRQINFFLGPEDQTPFEKALREVGELVVLRARPNSPTAEVVQGTVITRFGEEPLRVLLARPADVGDIKFRSIKGREDYSCNPGTERVVEFDRCYVTPDFIRPGRLYFIPNYYDDANRVIDKPREFVDWADGLLGAARRVLKRAGPNFFAGDDALKLREAGVRLEGLS